MGRICTICRHPERAEIDRLLVEGTAYRELTKRFGNSRATLSRHRNGHIPVAVVKAREAVEVDQGLDLFGQIMDLNERTLRILGRAEASNDPRLALSAIKEARGNLELLCKAMCSQMPQQARGGSGGYVGNGYQNGHAAPEEKRPDLSFLTDEEFNQLCELLRRADEREREPRQPAVAGRLAKLTVAAPPVEPAMQGRHDTLTAVRGALRVPPWARPAHSANAGSRHFRGFLPLIAVTPCQTSFGGDWPQSLP